MEPMVFLHNPHCSKSREALALLRQNGVEPEIRLYLEQPLSPHEIQALLEKLQCRPQEIVRTKEEDYQALALRPDDDVAVMAAICAYPKILERPIAYRGNRAVIGRPPENILDLLS